MEAAIAVATALVAAAGLARAEPRPSGDRAADPGAGASGPEGSSPADGARARTRRLANIEPPRLKVGSKAEYPARAIAEGVREAVTVELVLEVDRSGRVTRATVASHDPRGLGFDEAATAAATSLVFEPATRDGAPTAAKIRFSYAFVPPAATVTGRVLRTEGDAPIEGATVTVRDASGGAHARTHVATTAADGSFRVDDVSPGNVIVRAEAQGRRGEEAEEELGPGEEGDFTLRLDERAEDAARTRPARPDGGAKASEPTVEVRVRAPRAPREVTKRSITRDEIQHIPGTNGDALRSVQGLPGVARPPPLGGALVVRGSAPQDTNTFVDGTGVPIVYHFGGLSSVLPSEVLERIDFYPGNYGAQYGRGMGGVVEVGIRAPRADGKVHGMGQIDLIDARVLVESALGKGWSFLAAGRRSWFDVWLGPLLERGTGVSTAPRYYDYQAILRKELGPGHEVRLMLFGSDDRVDVFGANSGGFSLASGTRAAVSFWRLQALYRYRVDAKTRISATVAVGEDRTKLAEGAIDIDFVTTPISARAEVSRRVADALALDAGFDLVSTPYDATMRVPRLSRPGVPESALTDGSVPARMEGTAHTPGVYALAEITPLAGTRIVPGFRADLASYTRRWDLSPRVAVRQDLGHGGPRTTIKGGVGLYWQPPGFIEVDPTLGTPGLGSNRSVHYSAGMEQELGAHVELSVEGFYKSLDRLVVQGLGNTGDGRAYGAEWLLRWRGDPKLFGWIAYTLMRSERRSSPADDLRLAPYDQTHILTAILSRTLGGGFRIGGRFRLVSGKLYTPQHYGALDVDRATYLPVASAPPGGERLGAFHQLDLRVDKTWDLGPVKLTAYADVQNVYFHRSAEGVAYNFNYTSSAPLLGLPLLPILGVRGDL